jgi:hypothetical protein
MDVNPKDLNIKQEEFKKGDFRAPSKLKSFQKSIFGV